MANYFKYNITASTSLTIFLKVLQHELPRMFWAVQVLKLFRIPVNDKLYQVKSDYYKVVYFLKHISVWVCCGFNVLISETFSKSVKMSWHKELPLKFIILYFLQLTGRTKLNFNHIFLKAPTHYARYGTQCRVDRNVSIKTQNSMFCTKSVTLTAVCL